MNIKRRKITAADEDFIKIGNRILPKNAAGLGYADYDTVARAGKRAYDAEQEQKRLAAEKEAKKQKAAEAIEKFNQIYPGDVDKSNLNDVMEGLFDEFVPGTGSADSMAGEFIRAIERIRYRNYNDGDRFNQGYGLETCGPDAAFLAENTDDNISRMINDIAEHDASWPDQYYDEAIDNVAIAVVKYIADNLDLFGEDVIDSRDYDSSLVAEWEEWSHNLEYDPDLSGEYLDRLMEADLLDWDDVRSFIDDCIMDMGGNDNWWARDAVTITDLNAEEYDEWDSNFERWWAQWLDERMEENAEALEEYENGYDDEDEDEEY